MDGFDKRVSADGPVRQLQWQAEMEVIYAVTDTSVRFTVLCVCKCFQLYMYMYHRWYEYQLLTVHLGLIAPVALAMATLCVAGVWWRTNAQEEMIVRILTPGGYKLLEVQTNV